MIHIQNIPHILQEGFVHPASMRASRHYVSIGDAVVILKRNNRFIDQVHRISDYIPFYFGPRTPMLYVIQHGDGSISKILPGNIVYCVIKIEDIIRNHVDCVFTDGHALDGFTRCYPASELSNLNSIVIMMFFLSTGLKKKTKILSVVKKLNCSFWMSWERNI